MGIDVLRSRPGFLGFFEPSVPTPLGGGVKVAETGVRSGDSMIRAAKRSGRPGIVADDGWNAFVYLTADRLDLSNLPVGTELSVNGKEYHVDFASDGSVPPTASTVALSLRATTGR